MTTFRRHQRTLLSLAGALAVTLLLSATPSAAELTDSYYKLSCPKLEETVSQVVTSKQASQPATAAGTLRLFLHDCLVGGCDASLLVTSNTFNREAERDADINLSLPGDAFDAVVRAKAALELTCPATVSCADILAVATRRLVSTIGGPSYPLLLGRKDSLTSIASSVAHHLPTSNATVDDLIVLYTPMNLTTRELVALSGGLHTVGFTHCKEFADRMFNSNSGMNPKYAEALQKVCKNYTQDGNIVAFNDVMTPAKFDNVYFQNLRRGLGLLASDNALATDGRTKPIVEAYAANQTEFFDEFSSAMQKLSVYGVKTDKDGEVRRNCDKFNNIG